MWNYFGTDSAFHKYGSLVFDIILISLLWLVCSLPLITIGAATTATYYVSTKKIAKREGYILSDFFKSFKQNFIKATLLFIFILLFGYVLVTNMGALAIGFSLSGGLYIVQIYAFFQLTCISIYAFAILSRFELSLLSVIRASFTLANRHIFSTLTCMALVITTVMATFYVPIFSMLAGGVYIYVSSYFLIKVFAKHYEGFDVLEDEKEEGI